MLLYSVTLLVITLFICHLCSCARILGVFPIPSISHQVVYRAVIEELAKRGHHLVVMTPDPAKHTSGIYENVTEIDVHDLSYTIWKNNFNFAALREDLEDPTNLFPLFKDIMPDILDGQFSVPQMKALIADQAENFDLVLVESLVPITCMFAHRFKSPVIGVSSLSGLLSNFDAVGNPSHPLLYPDLFRKYLGDMNVWQKISTLQGDLKQRYYEWSYSSTYNALARKHFGESIPSIEEMESRMDLLFLNVHPLLAGVRPTVPAVVFLGSMHIQPKKELPKDIKSYLDNSKQGAIYFSLGSNVMSKDLQPERLQMFLAAFKELPYRVLWKFEDDQLPNKPDNVFLSKWFPQQDILGHPNVKAFITQGGLQSMEEGIHNSVPFVGIPFLADQDLNVRKMVDLGIGVAMDIKTMDKEQLKEALLKVIQDQSYRKRMKNLSDMLSDEPMSGKQRAVWWTEYVLRHGGARHLRAPAADVCWYEYFMLDVLLTLLLLCLTVGSVAFMSVRFLVGIYLDKRQRNKFKKL